MIRALVSLGKWLDSRFPARVTVTEASYGELLAKVTEIDEAFSIFRTGLTGMDLKLDMALERLTKVETAAVHKGAVQDLVKVVAQLKEDYTSFKASQGFTPTEVTAEVRAMLNGQYIPAFEESK